MTKALRVAMVALLLLIAGVTLVAWLGLRSDGSEESIAPVIASDVQDRLARGRYLALAGNCRGCHTERGGADYAGGRVIATSFGEFRTPNLTPDAATGIGRWSENDFWRAMHEGKRPDGAPLYPAFPYTHYTKISRAELYAYLQSVPEVNKGNLAHSLQFPYDQRWLVVAWRALFFRPGAYQVVATQDERWNRGAYLVQGLGHCGACHDARNALGAIRGQADAAGGVIHNWYAPALNAAAEAGVAAWSEDQVIALLRTGLNEKAVTLGPMAEVVYNICAMKICGRWLYICGHLTRRYRRRQPPRLVSQPKRAWWPTRGGRAITPIIAPAVTANRVRAVCRQRVRWPLIVMSP